MGVVFFPSLPFMGVMLFPSFALRNVSGGGDTLLVPPSLFFILLSLPLLSSPSPSFPLFFHISFSPFPFLPHKLFTSLFFFFSFSPLSFPSPSFHSLFLLFFCFTSHSPFFFFFHTNSFHPFSSSPLFHLFPFLLLLFIISFSFSFFSRLILPSSFSSAQTPSILFF